MGNPAQDYGKVARDSRKTSHFDNQSQAQELENLDILNQFWAKVTARSADYYDEYTIDVYADETLNPAAVVASAIKGYSVDLRRYSVNDVVRVYWRPATQFAMIFMRSPFAWIKLLDDWVPNQDQVRGQRCGSNGVLLEPVDDPIYVSLTGTGFSVAYCPFKKDSVVTYWRWPFTSPSTWVNPGSFDGICMGFPQIPIPTSLHQVLICVGQIPNPVTGGPDLFRIAFGTLRTMDRITALNDNTPTLEE